MTRIASISLSVVALALVGLVGGALADEGQGGLPAPDPKAKARLSVRWSPPREWSPLETREGEFAAYRLCRTRQEGRGEVTEQGPRLVLYYLGPLTKRRQLESRRAAWARRFLSPERRRLLPAAAKVRELAQKGRDPALAIHLVEVRGDYSAVLAPGQEPRPPQRDWTGVYAHVVAPDGVWVAVLLGPTQTTLAWAPELERLLRASKTGTVLIRPDPREASPRAPSPSATPAPRETPPPTPRKPSAQDDPR